MTPTWKVLISPTPIVGPDRDKKNDNHSNEAFTHEGDELRAWTAGERAGQFLRLLRRPPLAVSLGASGDRRARVLVGAASDSHAGGSPGLDEEYHRHHRVKGGFLTVSVTRQGDIPTIAFRHHDVEGKVVYEYVSPGQGQIAHA